MRALLLPIAALLALGPATSVVAVDPPAGGQVRLAAGSRAPTLVQYAPPVVPLRVVRGFDPPATPYGPGHRGVDLATAPAQVVMAAGPGVVRFAGLVAGRGVVVIQHPDGIATEYEPVDPLLRAGTPVARGDPIGRVDGRHGSCAPGRCLHWGARRGTTYLNPLQLLDRLGPVRLLPWSGS